jgi:pimeloyl-ACP methyl ester carboxylesterase
VYSSGNSNNPSILFLHGFPYDNEMWKFQMEELGKFFYCISFDQRGAGSLKNESIFSLEDMADDAIDFVESYSLFPYLCGLSMGGYVALRAIQKKQSIFKGLILCDTRSEEDSNESKIKRAESINFLKKNGVEKFVDNAVLNAVSNKTKSEKKDTFNFILEMAKRQSAIGLSSSLLAMQGRTNTSSCLSEITIPTLVICGEEDKITPAAEMKLLSEKINGAKFHIIPEVAHLSPVEQPNLVNQIIKDFIQTNETK